MKRHPLDKISLAAGIVFAATFAFWLVNRLIDEPIHPGWTAAGVFVLIGAVLVVSTLKNPPPQPGDDTTNNPPFTKLSGDQSNG